MSALVTSGKNRIAYNITRSLGEKGIRVFTADFVSHAMSSVSRYSRGHFVYPSPFRQQDAFIRSLVDGIGRLGSEVLIPVGEETYLIAKHKSVISRHARMVIPDYDQILLAHSKDRWAPLASGLGIRCPETFEAETLAAGRDWNELRFPLLIKPKQGGGGWGILQVDSAAELERLLSSPDYCSRPWNRFFLQEKIAGETHCVAMLFRQGEYRAKVGYRQLRSYPVKCGQATFRISTEHSLAERSLQRLLEAMGWHGVCQADFIIERDSGVPYLVDLNPRFWGSLAQAIASGVDFPYLLYRIAMAGDVPPRHEFRTGVVTRWVGGDMRAFFPLLCRAPDKLGFIREFLFPRQKAQYLDDLSLADPLPFIYWLVDALRRGWRKRKSGTVAHDSLEGIWE